MGRWAALAGRTGYWVNGDASGTCRPVEERSKLLVIREVWWMDSRGHRLML